MSDRDPGHRDVISLEVRAFVEFCAGDVAPTSFPGLFPSRGGRPPPTRREKPWERGWTLLDASVTKQGKNQIEERSSQLLRNLSSCEKKA